MPVKLQMEGLSEFKRVLRQLPENLAREAGDIVLSHAEDARSQIQAGYPTGPTGNLKAGVTIERNQSKFASSAIVRSRARHAHLFEWGVKRIRKTGIGKRFKKPAERGRMKAAPESQQMIPKVIRLRRRMVQVLTLMLEHWGFKVEPS